jgi:hypothetical protein
VSQALHTNSSDIETWQPTPAEWKDYVQSGLRDLGLTYEELAQQAHDRNFQSTDAMNFWVIIGER